jgi:hypothetical protein
LLQILESHVNRQHRRYIVIAAATVTLPLLGRLLVALALVGQRCRQRAAARFATLPVSRALIGRNRRGHLSPKLSVVVW